jgi:type VI secretion system protein ImpA
MDLVALLSPLPGTSPCGDDLSFSSEFDALRELRREDDPTLEQGEWVTALKVADWPGTAAACTRLLATRTKDIRVAAWLTEAWSRTDGAAGMADGLSVCTALCERFWREVHPRMDDGDPALRAGALHRLVGLVAALSTPVRAGPAGAHAPASRGIAPLESWRQAARELESLQRVVDLHLGAEGPSFSQAREAIAAEIRRLAQPAKHAPPAAAQVSQPVPAVSGEPSAARPTPDAPAFASEAAPMDRGAAIAQLRAVAAFFRRTEPHSPAAYLADKAADWAAMPLHAWLRAVVKDSASLAQLEDLLGVMPGARAPDATD